MNVSHRRAAALIGVGFAKGFTGRFHGAGSFAKIAPQTIFEHETYLMATTHLPIDSRQLRAFATLARTGSFTIAAKKLFLSQSAVSHSMKALETDVGCRLFDRMGKKVLLTQAGETLLHHAEKILHEMQAARSALYDLGKWGRGRLRIGASSTACQYILPPVLRQFKESFPQHLITIEPGDTLKAIDLLHRTEIDLAITLEPLNEPQLEFHPLFTDELTFIVAPTHPWAKEGQVNRPDIPRQNYILYNQGSYTSRSIQDYFKDEEMVLNTVIELGNMDAIKELIKLGLGVSILAPWIAQKDLQEGSLVALSLGRRKLKRQWGVAHWRSRRLSLAEETFLTLCKSVTEPLSSTAVAKSA